MVTVDLGAVAGQLRRPHTAAVYALTTVAHAAPPARDDKRAHPASADFDRGARRTSSHTHSGAVRRQGPRKTQKCSAQYEGPDCALRRRGRRTAPVESAHCAKKKCALRKKEVRTAQK